MARKFYQGPADAQSSFHDVTLLDTPLLRPNEQNNLEAGSEKPSSANGPTVRILRFGFDARNETSLLRQFDIFGECRDKNGQVNFWGIFTKIFPFLGWLTCYDVQKSLRGDISAGLSVAFMLIPQGMAYARVVGLNSVFGLYSGYLPAIVYGLFGTSRQLAVGPTALVSLLVGEAIRKYADTESTDPAVVELAVGLALLLALMVGAVQMFAGMVKLGWAVRFLSHAVVSGFSSGAAIIIGTTQMRYLLGYRFPRSDKFHIMIRDIWRYRHSLHAPSIVMGSLGIVFLLTMKHCGKSYKRLRIMRTLGPILTVAIGTLFICVSGNPWKIRVIGEIPAGQPKFYASFPIEYAGQLFVSALVISGAAYLESIGVAKTLAARNGYVVDASQELVGLGAANMVGSLFSAYPTGGSFSRSAVNNETGAKTGLAGMLSGVLVLLTLVYLTPYFKSLPLPILAAIVMSSVVGLVDYDEARFLLRVNEKDFIVWVLAFLGTLFCGVQVGVLVALIISLGFVINDSANAQCEILGRLPGTTVYRNVEQYPDAKTTPGIEVIRFHSNLYFANVVNFRESLRKYERLADEGGALGAAPLVQYVIIDMTSVHSVDSAACQSLMAIHHEYQTRGIRLAMANPSRAVMHQLDRAGIPEILGTQWFFVRIYDAVQLCRAEMSRTNNLQPYDSNSRWQQLPPPPVVTPPAQLKSNATMAPPEIIHVEVDAQPKQTATSPPMDIVPGTAMSADLSSISVPEAAQSRHVVLSELDEATVGVPPVQLCSVCKGVVSRPSGSLPPYGPPHIIVGDCICGDSDYSRSVDSN